MFCKNAADYDALALELVRCALLRLSRNLHLNAVHSQTLDDLDVALVAEISDHAFGYGNAFATGAFRNHALVAVSSDIMRQMTAEELRAVLGHEISHVANGDMVTMTLLQGVLNACVIFLSRVVAFMAMNAMSDGKGRRRGSNAIYYLVYYVMQFLLGIGAALIVNAFSRRREYAADRGSAELLVSPAPMIAALRRLGNLQPGVLPDSLKAMGISGKHASLFATHPSLEDRIAALERLQLGL